MESKIESDCASMSATDYRRSFYEQYVSAHFSNIRQISIDGLVQQTRFFRAYFGQHLPKNKDAAIADLGCGYGAFVRFLKEDGYINVVGVDISREQVEVAQKFGIKNIHCGDILKFLTEHPSEFQCVTAIDVVEHFSKEEVIPLLKSAYAALKPGGSLVMQAPNAANPFFGGIRYGDFTHCVAFTKDSAIQVLMAAGFKDVQVHPTGPVVHGLFSAGRWLLWNAIQFLLKVYLVAESGVFRGHVLTQNLVAAARKPL